MKTTVDTEQLGFDALLQDAEADNRNRVFARETAHMPGDMENAIPFYSALIEQHHRAMLAADVNEAMQLREEAHLLARKLNHGEPGILAHDDSPGCVLGRETAALSESIPRSGQEGEFHITVVEIDIRIDMEGIFGIGATAMFWLGFSAHAVNMEMPFLSETGYRSFLGAQAELVENLTPDRFASGVCSTYVEGELSGNLVTIAERYRH